MELNDFKKATDALKNVVSRKQLQKPEMRRATISKSPNSKRIRKRARSDMEIMIMKGMKRKGDTKTDVS